MDKFIALDIGNVCIKVDPTPAFKTLEIENNLQVQNDIFAVSELLETGKITTEKCFESFRKIVNKNYSTNEIMDIWNSVLLVENNKINDLLKSFVDNGYRLIFFSDTSEIHINYVYRTYSLANLVSGGIYSYEVGALKPSEKMYQQFEETYGKPSLYLDDKPCNIEGGQKYGWNSVLYDYNLPIANYADLLSK